MSEKITFEYLKACAKRAASAISFPEGIVSERLNNEFNAIENTTFFRLACIYRCYNNGERSDRDRLRVLGKQEEIQKEYERQMIV